MDILISICVKQGKFLYFRKNFETPCRQHLVKKPIYIGMN